MARGRHRAAAQLRSSANRRRCPRPLEREEATRRRHDALRRRVVGVLEDRIAAARAELDQAVRRAEQSAAAAEDAARGSRDAEDALRAGRAAAAPARGARRGPGAPGGRRDAPGPAPRCSGRHGRDRGPVGPRRRRRRLGGGLRGRGGRRPGRRRGRGRRTRRAPCSPTLHDREVPGTVLAAAPVHVDVAAALGGPRPSPSRPVPTCCAPTCDPARPSVARVARRLLRGVRGGATATGARAVDVALERPDVARGEHRRRPVLPGGMGGPRRGARPGHPRRVGDARGRGRRGGSRRRGGERRPGPRRRQNGPRRRRPRRRAAAERAEDAPPGASRGAHAPRSAARGGRPGARPTARRQRVALAERARARQRRAAPSCATACPSSRRPPPPRRVAWRRPTRLAVASRNAGRMSPPCAGTSRSRSAGLVERRQLLSGAARGRRAPSRRPDVEARQRGRRAPAPARGRGRRHRPPGRRWSRATRARLGELLEALRDAAANSSTTCGRAGRASRPCVAQRTEADARARPRPASAAAPRARSGRGHRSPGHRRRGAAPRARL